MSQMRVDASTGDLVREGGSFVRVTGLEEVAQHVRVRLRLFAGEVITNLTLGTRYFGLIFEPGTPPERVEGEITSVIIGTPGVVSVDDIDLEVDNETRRGTVDWDGTASLDDARARIPLHDKFSVSLRGEEILP